MRQKHRLDRSVQSQHVDWTSTCAFLAKFRLLFSKQTLRPSAVHSMWWPTTVLPVIIRCFISSACHQSFWWSHLCASPHKYHFKFEKRAHELLRSCSNFNFYKTRWISKFPFTSRISEARHTNLLWTSSQFYQQLTQDSSCGFCSKLEVIWCHPDRCWSLVAALDDSFFVRNFVWHCKGHSRSFTVIQQFVFLSL